MAAASLASWASPQPIESAISMVERPYELNRAATGATVPLPYSPQVHALFWGCREGSEGGSRRSDATCAAIQRASLAVDSAYLHNKELNLFADSLRKELRRSFSRDPKRAKAFQDPDFFRKIRCLSYLDTGSFAHKLEAAPISDADLRTLDSLTRSLRQDSQKRKDALVRESKYALLMERVIPDLGEFLRLADYIRNLPGLDSVWAKEPLREALLEHETGLLFDSIEEDSLRAGLRSPLVLPFRHKLRNLLHDAVWVQEEVGLPDYPLSSFLFGPTLALSQSDSAKIRAMVSNFGRRNAHLAIRFDAKDPVSLKDPRFRQLDRKVNVEIGRIVKEISPEFRRALENTPATKVALDLDGNRYSDYLGQSLMAGHFLQLAGSAKGHGPQAFAEWMKDVFPLADRKLMPKLAEVSSQVARKEILAYLGACTVAERNEFYLSLAPSVLVRYQGSSSQLKKVIAGKATI